MSLPDFIAKLTEDQYKLIEQVITWANVNSGSLNIDGLQNMAELCSEKLRSFADQVEVCESDEMEVVDAAGNVKTQSLGPVVIAQKRPKANRQVLLVGHMDTVFPKDNHFQSCKITDDGYLHGPGVADMKGGITAMLAALQAFENSPYKDQIGWTVLLNSDEEIGSHGSARYLKEYAQKAHIGMLYEPSMPDGTLLEREKEVVISQLPSKEKKPMQDASIIWDETQL